MQINNDEYGGFILSNNVIDGQPILYTWREESLIPELNGWTIYSIADSEEYVNNPDNFQIVSAETIYKYAPVLLEIFNAPYGTDLFWKYDRGTHVGFYDLVEEKDISIDEILNGIPCQIEDSQN